MKPFSHNYFLGYINEVTPQYIKIHFPSSILLNKFHFEGTSYTGGGVGNFVVIEGDEYGFLAQLTEVKLSDSEKKELTEKAIEHKDSDFHPIGKAELLLSFSVYEPQKIEKTVSKYPSIGAKVYSCSDDQIAKYVKQFGYKGNDDNIYASLGRLTSNNVECKVALNSLFGRHCAVVGTTGGGKSWTISKLIEEITKETDNKVILIDATGEYEELPNSQSFILGKDSSFPYQKLSISDLFYLLRPTGQSQRPILLEAIRSLKIQKLIEKDEVYVKAKTKKEIYFDLYRQNIEKIENNQCDFNINLLAKQIKEECVYPVGGEFKSPDYSHWGDYESKTYDYQTSLINRITDLLNTNIFNQVLGFKEEKKSTNTENTEKKIYEKISIIEKIDDFLKQGHGGVLRINFEEIPSSFSVKEIISNALATHLLNKARDKSFKENPIILILDEAHQFLNKSIKDEFFEMHSLDAFDLIAKECRKHGLFLCLATQMPRDIPIGTLSQMGTFIVHRLINEQDKKAIENAVSSASRNSLSFLPILGEGEALLVGVDFPMPLLLKIDEPSVKPNSKTPTFGKKQVNL
ncbi:ATP-binding protein [Capnocytophaga genosp. AHN8471]|uniref:ATP-binding protein n=1 Tax=Capnocytophaga genosp. AHN8471 TaxID=327574 RepID=UPI0019346406|nr:ATP-binding protein [Capnocytophaga genosp. AHN8471]MBM0656632.1 ATP-binding protein [Capnocytophaga genosp. AHN8471]